MARPQLPPPRAAAARPIGWAWLVSLPLVAAANPPAPESSPLLRASRIEPPATLLQDDRFGLRARFTPSVSARQREDTGALALRIALLAKGAAMCGPEGAIFSDGFED